MDRRLLASRLGPRRLSCDLFGSSHVHERIVVVRVAGGAPPYARRAFATEVGGGARVARILAREGAKRPPTGTRRWLFLIALLLLVGGSAAAARAARALVNGCGDELLTRGGTGR